jgi:membrane AbrB-like protein
MFPVSRGRGWGGLILLSAVLSVLLQLAAFPAAMLLGPMLAGVAFALARSSIVVPGWAFASAQAVIGCMVAHTVTAQTIATLAQNWPAILVCVGGILASGVVVGYLLMRLGSLPGNTAAWGTSPGGAAAMTAMAAAYGADVRMIGFMQYLRVMVVVLTASGVSRLLLGHAAASAAGGFSPGFDVPLPDLLQTLAFLVCGVVLGRASRLPAGALVLSMGAGAALHATGMAPLTLPGWLVWTAYAALGWFIGLRFTRQTLGHALRAIPQVLAATAGLMLLCGGAAWLMTVWLGVDALTAYLATSPGGLDSVAIIAMGSGCDVPFVLALQTLRLFAVVLLGPHMARLVCRLNGESAAPASRP